MTEATQKKRILHVDDEDDISEVVRTILEKEGFEVVSARSGIEALNALNEGKFDLLILDIMMPDMSGWDLFTRIWKLDAKNNIIFLSVIDIPDEKRKELTDAGVKDYIKKPFDIDDFVVRVKKAIQ